MLEPDLPMALHVPKKFLEVHLRILTICIKGEIKSEMYQQKKITVTGPKTVNGVKNLTQHFAVMVEKIAHMCSVSDFKVVNLIGSWNFG